MQSNLYCLFTWNCDCKQFWNGRGTHLVGIWTFWRCCIWTFLLCADLQQVNLGIKRDLQTPYFCFLCNYHVSLQHIDLAVKQPWGSAAACPHGFWTYLVLLSECGCSIYGWIATLDLLCLCCVLIFFLRRNYSYRLCIRKDGFSWWGPEAMEIMVVFLHWECPKVTDIWH